MIEEARRLCLLLKSMQLVALNRRTSREDFDRDLAAEACVLRTVNVADAALTDELANLIRTQLAAWRQLHMSPAYPLSSLVWTMPSARTASLCAAYHRFTELPDTTIQAN